MSAAVPPPPSSSVSIHVLHGTPWCWVFDESATAILHPVVPVRHPMFCVLAGWIQITVWGRGELEAEVEKGLWRPAVASKMALLRTRDRKGPDVAKPMVRQTLACLCAAAAVTVLPPRLAVP